MVRGTGLHGPVPAARGAPAMPRRGAPLVSLAWRTSARDPQGHSAPDSAGSAGASAGVRRGQCRPTALRCASPFFFRAPFSLRHLLCGAVLLQTQWPSPWLHPPAMAPPNSPGDGSLGRGWPWPHSHGDAALQLLSSASSAALFPALAASLSLGPVCQHLPHRPFRIHGQN